MASYWQIFISFFKIGSFTLGGGYAMIPLIQQEVVDKKGWLKENEFVEMMAIAQSAHEELKGLFFPASEPFFPPSS